jgi:two-component system, OmpR family, response regulator VicR
MGLRILVVEDDKSLSQIIVDNLTSEGYEVAQVSDGDAAIKQLRAFQPDLVLLDIMLPNRNGFEICSVIRQRGQVPVIIVSARGLKADKIRGLNLGADDYLTKPFELEELLARVQAVLRRSRQAVERITLGEVVIDLRAMKVSSGSQPLHLTHREFEILRFLAERQGRIVYRNELLREIWGYVDIDVQLTTRSVDHAITRLRKKLEPDPHHPLYIQTVRGDGYSLNLSKHPEQTTGG